MFGFLINVIDLLSFLNHFGKREEKMTLDELAKLMSDHTDRIILDIMKNEEISFGGGVFEIIYNDQKNKEFNIHLKLYFLDKDGEILLKETSKTLAISALVDSALLELKQMCMISYSIHKPTD